MFERVPMLINTLAEIIQNEITQQMCDYRLSTWLDRAMGKPRREIEQVGGNEPLQIMIRHFTDGAIMTKSYSPITDATTIPAGGMDALTAGTTRLNEHCWFGTSSG